MITTINCLNVVQCENHEPANLNDNNEAAHDKRGANRTKTKKLSTPSQLDPMQLYVTVLKTVLDVLPVIKCGFTVPL